MNIAKTRQHRYSRRFAFAFAFTPAACARVILQLALATAAAFTYACHAQNSPSNLPRRGMVATVDPLATQAGLRAFDAGGNAIDAAVACALTLGVVDGHNSGIGGGCFWVIRLANGKMIALDARETAPSRARENMFQRDGKAVAELSLHGPLAAGVPGELASLQLVARKYGRLPLAHALNDAATVAEKGFPASRAWLGRLRDALRDLDQPKVQARLPSEYFEGFRAAFLGSPPSLPAEGDLIRQTDLAQTYRTLAREGVDWFYKGEFARRTEAWMTPRGGLLRARDFRAYSTRSRDPVRSTYRGHEIVGFPPPSSGGVHVAEILNLLEPYDLKQMGEQSADFVHVVTEAMKLAFADRAVWLGDPDFARVPRGLIHKKYAQKLGAGIRLDRASAVEGPGTPDNASRDYFGKHTTHFSTADALGNWVACTATINTSYGSKVVIPGTGVVLNNQMDDFSAQPGVPNGFGLVGGSANAVRPGKRPLSSMSPTIVLRNGAPILSVGAAGGPTIISQTLLAIIQTIDFGKSPAEALAAPRFHHQWRPDELLLEAAWGDPVASELARRGHKIKRVSSLGATQAVGRSADGSAFAGAHDPRVPGLAAGR